MKCGKVESEKNAFRFFRFTKKIFFTLAKKYAFVSLRKYPKQNKQILFCVFCFVLHIVATTIFYNIIYKSFKTPTTHPLNGLLIIRFYIIAVSTITRENAKPRVGCCQALACVYSQLVHTEKRKTAKPYLTAKSLWTA